MPHAVSIPNLAKLDLRRRKLGMSRAALARRSGVSVPQIHRVLSGKEKSPGVATVQAIAAALGMEVRLVEVVEEEEFRRWQAEKKGAQLARMTQGTMGLESQAVDSTALQRLAVQNAHRLLAGSGRNLWED